MQDKEVNKRLEWYLLLIQSILPSTLKFKQTLLYYPTWMYEY